MLLPPSGDILLVKRWDRRQRGGRNTADTGDGEAGAAATRDQPPTSGNDGKAGGGTGFAVAAGPDYDLKYKLRDDRLLA